MMMAAIHRVLGAVGRMLNLEVLLVFLTVTWAGGIFGLWTYVGDQRDAAERDNAAVAYVAAQAEWENARVARQTCELLVENRAAIRQAFFGVFELLERLRPETSSEWTGEARALLNRTHPLFYVEDCPFVPNPPTPPPAE